MPVLLVFDTFLVLFQFREEFLLRSSFRSFSYTSVVLVRSFSYPADASFSSVRSALGTSDANILMKSFTFTPRALWF